MVPNRGAYGSVKLTILRRPLYMYCSDESTHSFPRLGKQAICNFDVHQNNVQVHFLDSIKTSLKSDVSLRP